MLPQPVSGAEGRLWFAAAYTAPHAAFGGTLCPGCLADQRRDAEPALLLEERLRRAPTRAAPGRTRRVQLVREGGGGGGGGDPGCPGRARCRARYAQLARAARAVR